MIDLRLASAARLEREEKRLRAKLGQLLGAVSPVATKLQREYQGELDQVLRERGRRAHAASQQQQVSHSNV